MSWSEAVKRRWQVSNRLSSREKAQLEVLRVRVPDVPNILWVLSSGTQSVGSLKAVGIQESAFLAAAAAANQHLKVGAKDRWLLAIPEYHVGGLAILARAHLSNSKVVKYKRKWSAQSFCEVLLKERITLTSLVPTQVFDLVSCGLKPAKFLRAVVVGGGALDHDLYKRARALGWPLLPSYGLSETSAQVATASLQSLGEDEFPTLSLLPGVKVELREQRIFILTPGVCTYVAVLNAEDVFTLESPLREGFLPTEDLANWLDGGLRILGRADSVVKVLGVLVPLLDVESELASQLRAFGWQESISLIAVPNARSGNQLILFTDSARNLRDWWGFVKSYNKSAIGPRRVETMAWVPQIPRAELGKVRRRALVEIWSGEAEILDASLPELKANI